MFIVAHCWRSSYLVNNVHTVNKQLIQTTHTALEEILYLQYHKNHPTLINIFVNDLLLFNADFTNYADDSSSYCAGDSIDDLILSLEDFQERKEKKFSDNQKHETLTNNINF